MLTRKGQKIQRRIELLNKGISEDKVKKILLKEFSDIKAKDFIIESNEDEELKENNPNDETIKVTRQLKHPVPIYCQTCKKQVPVAKALFQIREITKRLSTLKGNCPSCNRFLSKFSKEDVLFKDNLSKIKNELPKP